MDRLDLKDRPGREARPDRPARLDRWAPQAKREQMDRLGLKDRPGREARPDRPARLDRWAPQAKKELMARLDRRELLALAVTRVPRVLPDQWEFRVLSAKKVRQGRRGHKVLLASAVKWDRLALPACKAT